EAVERAIHLVEQLLALARSEPEEAAADFAAVDLAATVADSVRDTHELALSRHIDLGLEGSAGVMVRGDREGLRVLARNLIDNAVRYTPPHGPVQVRVHPTPSGAV